MNKYDIVKVHDDETLFSRYELERSKQIINYRTQTVVHGNQKDVRIYPVYPHTPKPKRGKRQYESKPSQKNLNDKKAHTYCTHIIDHNFTNKDLMVTLTYSDDALVVFEKARKDVVNYLRRLGAYLKRHNLGELKYVYVIEYDNSDEHKIRVHHHIVLSGNVPRDVCEEKWTCGFVNTKRLQANEYGFTALANYITKTKQSTGKRFATSQNLKRVPVFESDYKTSKRKAFDMHKNENYAIEQLQKMNKGYLVNDVQSIFSDISGGIYLVARLRKIPVTRKAKNQN